MAVRVGGVDPKWIMTAPVYAVEKLLDKTDWDRDRDVDLVELNEAFAVAAIAVTRELRLDPAKVNVNGGAVALTSDRRIGRAGQHCSTKCNGVTCIAESPHCAWAAANETFETTMELCERLGKQLLR